MSTPRRRIVRPAAAAPIPDVQHQRRLQKLRSRLDGERAALGRWMARLKRAFHAVEKTQQRVARLERQVTQWEE